MSSSPPEFVLRPPRDDEAAAIVEVMNALPLAFGHAAEMSEEELRHWFTSPSVDVDRDVRVVERGGVLTAYADVGDQSELHTRYWLDLRAHPERARGDELDAIVEWAQERSRGDAAEGAIFRAFVDEQDAAAADAVRRAGLELIRHSYRMAIELGDGARTPRWPDGISVRSFDEADARVVYEAQQESFADMWEHTPDPYEEWKHWMISREGFDPSLWFLAEDGDHLAGIALCRTDDNDDALGRVSVLGVRRPWRRRGLGRALLEHAFGEFQKRGYRTVNLGVDAESLTGAQRLYEQAGMRVIRRFDIYEKPLS